MLNESSLREFYEHVYPVELVTRWLSYTLVTPQQQQQQQQQPSIAHVTAAAATISVKQRQDEAMKHEDDDDDDDDSSAASVEAKMKRRRVDAAVRCAHNDENKHDDGDGSVTTTTTAAAQGTSSHATDAATAAAAVVATAVTRTTLTAQGEAYLSRREFCFTLLGDIFTRYRSYSSASELRAELLRCFPEKIDAGAVYNVRPSLRQSVSNVVPLERELVFDIDMSDYDAVRSCCSGKSICAQCWPWMVCAVRVLRAVLTCEFGFKYLLPVFSGRRGVHVWVCDKRARRMHDDERAALVGYVSAITPKEAAAAVAMTSSSSSSSSSFSSPSPLSRYGVVAELAQHRPVHPTLRRVASEVLLAAFVQLFCGDDASNANNVRYHAQPAALVHTTLLRVLQLGRREHLQRYVQHAPYHDGDVLDWPRVCRALGSERECSEVLQAVAVLLMYPRLDEHVSTRRDHLLKLPFCVHPATGQLCCPLSWSQLALFDPTRHAPTLSTLLLTRSLDKRWLAPLEEMLAAMAADADEAR